MLLSDMPFKVLKSTIGLPTIDKFAEALFGPSLIAIGPL